ncbi:hypothetical protein [Actinoplanes sp. NPDC026619]
MTRASREADQGIASAIDKAVKSARRKPGNRPTERPATGRGTAAEAS